MSLFDLQDVCIAIGSIATLDLPMVIDLIGIYGLKGPYCTLTTTNWFLQALSVIPRGSWGDVARRSYHDPLGKSGIVIPEPQWLWAHSCIPETLRVTQVLDSRFPHGYSAQCVEHEKSILGTAAAAAARLRRKIVSGQFDEENPFVLILSVLLVQADEGVSFLVVDRIGDFYRNLPRRADVIVTTVGVRHKCQQDSHLNILCMS
ncbi:helicase domain-containing family protein [Dorcoceras hygrometricum]|uniref:Helicase domain-containing family protein n=1 Tax=Dorcoceras hygrometricum TaxID=472368 RepID=A0A2Z7BPT5_9LAMI|nr:helicase domain-containing family protein [Dorcoceras hygrometricum]